MDPLTMENTPPSMWLSYGVALSISFAKLVLLLVHDEGMSSQGRANVQVARRVLLCALLGSLVEVFLISTKYGQIVRAVFGTSIQLLVLLGVLSLLAVKAACVKDMTRQKSEAPAQRLAAAIAKTGIANEMNAARRRHRRLGEVNGMLLEMKDTMERQLQVVNSLKTTWTSTVVLFGMSLATSGCSKVVQIPLAYSRSKQKRQAAKEFKLSQIKAADIYYCFIEHEEGSEADLLALPDSGPDKLLLTKEEWRTQRGSILAKLREAVSDASNTVADRTQLDNFLEGVSDDILEIPFDTVREQLGEAAWDIAVDLGLAECLVEFGIEALSLLL